MENPNEIKDKPKENWLKKRIKNNQVITYTFLLLLFINITRYFADKDCVSVFL